MPVGPGSPSCGEWSMPALKQFALLTTVVSLVAFSSRPVRVAGAQEKSDPGAKQEAAPPASTTGTSKEGEPELKQILERLSRVEREVVELRIKSGKVPEDKKDQRIITL